MKTIEAVVAVLIVILGASFVLDYSLYTSNQQLSSSFNNLNQSFYNLNQKYNELAGLNASQSISMTNEPIGLNLRVAMNTTSIQSGQSIDVIISETNTLNTTNTVNVSDQWQLSSLSFSLGPCGNLGYPIGIVIFKGYHTYSNISTAESLDLYQPGTYFCPAGFFATSFSFQPLSNMASVNEAPNSSSSLPMTSEVTASGYWTDNYPLDYTGVNATFSNFQPGIYTVVGGDEWGQLVLLHFIVS
jgi:hypothetical protein